MSNNNTFYSTDLGMADRTSAIAHVPIIPGPITLFTINEVTILRALFIPMPLFAVFCRPTKRCKQCNEVKPRALFSKRTASKDGLKHRCKDCLSEKGSIDRKLRNAEYLRTHTAPLNRSETQRKRWQSLTPEQQQSRIIKMNAARTYKDWPNLVELRESGLSFRELAKIFNASVGGTRDAYIRLAKEK